MCTFWVWSPPEPLHSFPDTGAARPAYHRDTPPAMLLSCNFPPGNSPSATLLLINSQAALTWLPGGSGPPDPCSEGAGDSCSQSTRQDPGFRICRVPRALGPLVPVSIPPPNCRPMATEAPFWSGVRIQPHQANGKHGHLTTVRAAVCSRPLCSVLTMALTPPLLNPHLILEPRC